MAFNKTEKTDSPMRKKGGMRRRKKVCVFCGKDNVIDYKDTAKLKKYVSERGKILPRRITGDQPFAAGLFVYTMSRVQGNSCI